MLVGLVGDPTHELISVDLGAAGQIERHRLPDLVRLQLLGQPDALQAHGVAGGTTRVQKDLEGGEQEEEGKARWISEAWGKVGIPPHPLL
jgi:hypothetical protein